MTSKVLHITPWYPTTYDKHEALFIKEHVNALNNYCVNEVLCIKLITDSKHFMKFEKQEGPEGESIFICKMRTERTVITELVAFLMLFWLLVVRKKAKNVDIVNMNIANFETQIR